MNKPIYVIQELFGKYIIKQVNPDKTSVTIYGQYNTYWQANNVRNSLYNQ